MFIGSDVPNEPNERLPLGDECNLLVIPLDSGTHSRQNRAVIGWFFYTTWEQCIIYLEYVQV